VLPVWERIADLRPTPPAIAFESLAPLWYMPSGWYPPRLRPRGRPEGERDEAGSWTRGPVATLEVPLARPAPLRVRLRVSPVADHETLPEQRIILRWNGEPLERFVVAEPSLDVGIDVPLPLQRVGLNVLTLLPHFFADPSPEARRLHEQRRGIRVERIWIEAEGGVPLLAAPPPVAEAVVQPAGGLASYYLPLPDAARLRGTVRLGGATAEAPAPGEAARLWLRRDREPEAIEWSASGPALAAGAPLDIDLSAWGGSAAALILRAPRGAGLVWEQLRVEGERPATPDARAEPARTPNLLVVLFDTLRADFTEPYGADDVDTPNLVRLAGEGITFTDAIANAPSTRASVATLFSGVHPDAHDVADIEDRLAEGFPTLAERLRDAGYWTVALSNNPHVSAASGLDRGFDRFVPFYEQDEQEIRRRFPAAEARARHTWERHLAPALAERGERPFFLYLHEIDPHFPYDPLPPFDERYDFGYPGALANEPARSAGGEPSHWQVLRLMKAANDIPGWLQESDLRHLRARYAGEVSYVDAYLGWLLDHLEATGLRDDTVVVFVSDHGEQFFEHGTWTHGGSVHHEELGVPFVMSLPDRRGAGRRIEVRAQLLDLAPTLLELAGAERPAHLQGRSLRPWLHGAGVATPGRPRFAQSNWVLTNRKAGERAFERQTMVRWRDWKLVRTRHKEPGHRYERFALYDVARDPGEQIDRWSEAPFTANALRHLLLMQEQRDTALQRSSEPATPDPETREQLRALGYAE